MRPANATANVAMLLRDPATGKILVRVANARTNVTAATVRGYNPSFAPVKLAQVADINGNGLDEYALLARNAEHRPGDRRGRATAPAALAGCGSAASARRLTSPPSPTSTATAPTSW